MRLIDADMLKDDGANYVYERSLTHDIVETEYRFVDRLQIDAAPTIEAIPIDWLRMWFTKKASLIGITLMSEIESDWEKENGKDSE